MGAKLEKPYRYTISGLDDVFIHGLNYVVDDDGEQIIEIPNVNGLHAAIAASIVKQQAAMTGKHLRFLRTEMGLSQAELARMVHKDHQTVGRWERGDTPMDTNADVLIRLIAIERLDLLDGPSPEEVSRWCTPTADTAAIAIDGSDPTNYRPIAA